MSFVWKKVRILAPENEATTKYVQVHCVPVRNVCACTSMHTSLLCSVYCCIHGWDCQLAISLCGFSPLETVQISFSFGFSWLSTLYFRDVLSALACIIARRAGLEKKLLWQSDSIYFQFQRRSHAVQKSRVSYFVIYCWKLHGSSLKLVLEVRVRNTCSKVQVFCHNKRIANNNNYYNLFWLKAKAFNLKMQESRKKRACINLSPYSNCY